MRLSPRRISAVLILGSGLLGGGCYPGETICTDEAVSGIRLDILDSVTRAGKAAEALAIAAEGSYRDTLEFWGFPDNTTSQWGLTERGGTYDLTVTAPGYLTWSKNDVVIHENECHVEPISLEVLLQPMP